MCLVTQEEVDEGVINKYLGQRCIINVFRAIHRRSGRKWDISRQDFRQNFAKEVLMRAKEEFRMPTRVPNKSISQVTAGLAKVTSATGVRGATKGEMKSNEVYLMEHHSGLNDSGRRVVKSMVGAPSPP